MEPEKFKLMDIFYGVIIPLILVLLVYVLAVYVNPSGTHHVLGTVGTLGTIAVIFTEGFAQMIIMGIPLVVGLLWNKWGGGAAGFITGGLYYVSTAGLYTGYYAVGPGHSVSSATYNFFGDTSLLFWLVNAVIIGYMAGALNNRSTNFKRMLGAGLTAALITATLQAYFNSYISLAPSRSMAAGLWKNTSLGPAGVYGFVLDFVPSIALGVIVPIIAKVMTWYGIQPMRH